MVETFGSFLGLSKQTEMLFMSLISLWLNIFDMAIFEIGTNLEQVWNVEIDPTMFNPKVAYTIRILLSGVVFIRTFTLHLNIAFLIAVFWPVCFGTRPTLMLPWLIVSAIKNLVTGLISMLTGGYTCFIYGPFRPACLRFLLSQFVDLSPSFYMWIIGLSLYHDLEKPKPINKINFKTIENMDLDLALRRRKAKLSISEDIYRDEYESEFRKKYFGESSLDIDSAIYNNLKNSFSRSLDSLLDALTLQVEMMDLEDDPLDIGRESTIQEKSARLLGISMSDVNIIKQIKRSGSEIHFNSFLRNNQRLTKYESPLKLLPETSLYTPNRKPSRSIRSDINLGKNFIKLQTPSEFLRSFPEIEMKITDLTKFDNYMPVPSTQMVFQTDNIQKDKKIVIPKRDKKELEEVYSNPNTAEDFEKQSLKSNYENEEASTSKKLCKEEVVNVEEETKVEKSTNELIPIKESDTLVEDLFKVSNSKKTIKSESNVVKKKKRVEKKKFSKTSIEEFKAVTPDKSTHKTPLCKTSNDTTINNSIPKRPSVKLLRSEYEDAIEKLAPNKKMKKFLPFIDPLDLAKSKRKSISKPSSPISSKAHIETGCQASTLSKKILLANASEISKQFSSKLPIEVKRQRSLKSQKVEPLVKTSAQQMKTSNTTVTSRTVSTENSYVSIHKARLERAKSAHLDQKHEFKLQNIHLLEDGYSRMYNLICVENPGVDPSNNKANNRNIESTLKF